MTKVLQSVNAAVWGAPALVLILGVGLYLSVKLSFVQILLFPRACLEFLRKLRPGKTDASAFRALCTALAATVGTGNLVGVAGAICLGGPGAVFWMWICGILGMATKFSEVTLALRYRKETKGGPMYVITGGLGSKWKPLAVVYCAFGIVAAFGVGNVTQINAMITGLNGVIAHFGGKETAAGNFMMGLVLAALVGSVLLGGAGRIGAAAEKLVPFVSGLYILMCVGVLIACRSRIPGAFAEIILGAFSPRAVTGGALGSAFTALRTGCSRGVFTNEAGMGTASIAHAQANVRCPAEQGLMGIMEVFLDTILICTMTALAILCSGVPIPYGTDAGGILTTQAFAAVYGSSAKLLLAFCLCCFAFATVLGWGLYGARCAEFLFGAKSWKVFALAQTAAVTAGAVLDTASVWAIAETVNGLMAIPNLITLAMLSNETLRLTNEYKKSGPEAGGGTYANFHQCKPLRTLSHEKVPPSGGCRQERGQEDLPSEHRPARSAHSGGLLRSHP